MKNKLLINIALLSIGFSLQQNIVAQQVPTTTSPDLPALNGRDARDFWSRAGNSGIGINNQNNIFGTLGSFNSPIYTQTNGVFREKLNGDFTSGTQYPINGYTFATGVNTSGYLLLGQNNPTQPGGASPLLYNAKGAFSLLHLNDPQSTIPGAGFTQEFGYRPWMKTGITFTGNNDLTVFASDLSNGIYTYTLVADGKIVETKKMVKQQ
jgi:hypothetical protein